MTELLIIKALSRGTSCTAAGGHLAQRPLVPDLRISWIVREIFAPLVRACAASTTVYVF